LSSTKRSIYYGIILFGIISMLGDTIYEGARSVVPSYMETIGVSALIIGVVFGVGEFLGYALRIISGLLADITRAYWHLFIIGYVLLISVPLLGVVRVWYLVAALVIVERIAKALRSPSRDVLISIVSKGVGAGKAFGIHELLDQVGAIAGPALLALTLYLTLNDYSKAFTLLLIPYLALVTVVMLTYTRLKHYTEEYKFSSSLTAKPYPLPYTFKLYIIAVGLNTAGLIHVSLILYRLTGYLSHWVVPLLYLSAQAVDAIVAPIAGLLYDRYGRSILLVPFLLSILVSITAVIGGLTLLVVSIIVFGLVYGMQESIYRAAVSDITPIEKRGLAYGIFNTVYGLGLLAGGSLFGMFLSLGYTYTAIAYTLFVEVLAIMLLMKSIK